LVVVLTVGGIAAERGTLADSVLSRGISRYQFFLAKLHARLLCVLLTFTVLTTALLVTSHFLVHEDVSLDGSLVVLTVLAVLLLVVVTCGVTVGALTANPILGIGVLWLLLYAGGFLLSFLPKPYPTPDRVLDRLPQILQGTYDIQALGRMMGVALAASAVVMLVGLVSFARTDV
jgi:putative exporter of polyketide antibiotics